MKTKGFIRILCLILSVSFIFIFAACSGAEESGAPESTAPESQAPVGDETYTYPEMTIQLGHISTEGEYDMYHIFATNFADNVAEMSDGAITIEIIANGQLGGERDMVEGMQIGTLDCGIVGYDTLAIVEPSCLFPTLPYVFFSNQDAWNFIDGETNKEICQNTYDNAGIKVLGTGCIGFRNLMNNSGPVYTPDDLKGMKLRVVESAIMVDTYSALGCNPTPIAFAELFTSLQQGTVDGCDFPIVTAYTSRLFEVCDYFSPTRAFFNSTTISMSASYFDSLDTEVQNLLEEAAKKAGIAQREYCNECEEMMLGWLQDEGVEVNEDVDYEAFQEIVTPIYDEYRSVIGEDLFNRGMAEIDAAREA